MLSKLIKEVDPCVFKTNMHEVKGLDFKIYQKTNMIKTFN